MIIRVALFTENQVAEEKDIVVLDDKVVLWYATKCHMSETKVEQQLQLLSYFFRWCPQKRVKDKEALNTFILKWLTLPNKLIAEQVEKMITAISSEKPISFYEDQELLNYLI